MSLLDNRNKLISIADRDGWDVVEYFEADPLTKSKMGTRFKSQSTSSKSGPGANFRPSHRIVDFRPDIGQLRIFGSLRG